MKPAQSYAKMALWTALFPALVIIGEIPIYLEGTLIMTDFKATSLIAPLIKYTASYTLIIIAILLLAKKLDNRGVIETAKWLGWPRDKTDGVLDIMTGLVFGVMNILALTILMLLHILTLHSFSMVAVAGSLGVALVGPPEEMARCYAQRKLAELHGRSGSGRFGDLLCLVCVTVAFGFSHEVGRLFSNLLMSRPVYLFAPQDFIWYMGGFILAALYLVKKSWFSNSVAHSSYNLLVSLMLR